MTKKVTQTQTLWEQQRSWLLDYAEKNSSKDQLLQNIQDVISECPLSTDCISPKKASSKAKKNNLQIIGSDLLGLNNQDISELVNSLPGDWLSTLKYSNTHAPAHKCQSTGKQLVVFIDPDQDNRLQMDIYDPTENFEGGSEVLCHGCVQAHVSANFPSKISKKSVDSITRALNNVKSGEFHSTHKENIANPGRSYSQMLSDKIAVLLSSVVQTAYEAPFYNENQDWTCATSRALMGMQYLSEAESKDLVEALALYFSEVSPEADMNKLIRNYQNQVKLIEFKILINHIAELFAEMPDKGLKSFFSRWVKHLDQDTLSPVTELKNFKYHVPSLRVGMALDDAKELGANLATSLRVQASNTKDKRKVLHDLRTSIRRFNDIWQDLDKNEQKTIRPKLLQIVHASLY